MLFAVVALTILSLAILWHVSAPMEDATDASPYDHGDNPPDHAQVRSVIVFDALDEGDALVLDPDELGPDNVLRMLARFAADEGVAFLHDSPRACVARVGPTRYALRLAHFPALARFVILIDEAPLDSSARPPRPGREWLVFSNAIDRAMLRMDVDDVQWFARQDLPSSALPDRAAPTPQA